MVYKDVVARDSADDRAELSAEAGRNEVVMLVAFQLNGHYFALPLEDVERVLRMVAITPVPDAHPLVAGMINLHGKVVPVVELRRVLGQPPKDYSVDERLLVVSSKRCKMAIIVDQVLDVLEVPVHEVEPLPEPLALSRPLAGVTQWNNILIQILDSTKLIPEEEGERGEELMGEGTGTWPLGDTLSRMEKKRGLNDREHDHEEAITDPE